MIRFQFVDDHRTEYPVKRMCQVLKLNRSSFYKWVNTCETRQKRMCADALVGAKIKTIFDDEHGLYGAKRIAASLKEDTDLEPVNHKKVARIMKAMGLEGFTKRRRCITTKRAPGHRVMPDLVNRNFTATAQDKLVFGIFSALAEFERELISERTKAGLESARTCGRKGGRPFKMTPAKVHLAMASMGQPETSVAALCKELGVTRQILYRHVSPTGELREDGRKLLAGR